MGSMSLNEGRSVNPGYTRWLLDTLQYQGNAQRRPERQPRLHLSRFGQRVSVPSTLNEGRSVNPGYTWVEPEASARHLLRSTKAGASTPATPESRICLTLATSYAQRRPERQPRLHPRPLKVATTLQERSTKAGASTPATLAVLQRGEESGALRSTKAGASTPATHDPEGRVVARRHRSTKAGASTPATHRAWQKYAALVEHAQRRPERQPRLHRRAPNHGGAVDLRSTKAGASTPATLFHGLFSWRITATLNEGRSVNPGYTGRSDRVSPPARALNEGRSVNPGYTRRPREKANRSRRAQRRPERQPRLHALQRGASAWTWTWALNEGRSVNPGYTRGCGEWLWLVSERSTKAGASTPATPATSQRLRGHPRALNEGRSVNPGYTGGAPSASSSIASAQRRPERQPRLHAGGASSPGCRLTPLNEGRSVNPGYTRTSVSSRVGTFIAQRRPERQPRLHAPVLACTDRMAWSAQRRPERQPRLHDQDVGVLAHRALRSTKAGASTPATLLNSAKGQYRDKPSLAHGRGSLDGDVFAAISRDFGRYPVRMVRIKR